MSNETKTNYRHFEAWRSFKLSKNPIIRPLRTSHRIDDELWSILEYYSDIKDVGIDFIKKKGINKYPTYEKAFNMFQGFVRQAKNYYNAANVLHYRSSSLLFYYSFLNLVKSYLILDKPDKIIDKKIRHGLEFSVKDNRPFHRQRIIVKKVGVFPAFYESETGNSLPNNTRLNIVNLFSYCREISYQYESGDFGVCKMLPCFLANVINNTIKKNWAIIAIREYNKVLQYKKILKSLEEYFDIIELPRDVARKVFQIDAWNYENYKYYQSKKLRSATANGNYSTKEINEELRLALRKVFDGNYYPDNYGFVISLPYFPYKQYQMNELLAIYSIFYYLGSLVRYKPEYLEKLLNTKPAWLIENFVRSCPLIFLQIIISRILGVDFIIQKI